MSPFFYKGFLSDNCHERIGDGYNPHITLTSKKNYQNQNLEPLLEQDIIIDKIMWCFKKNENSKYENHQTFDLKSLN